MTATEIKKYIYDNDKIPDILEDLGCTKIKYHNHKDYYSAAQPDGDNPHGVVISNNEYLNYASYSRGINYKDRKDIFAFIQSVKNVNFSSSLKYLHELLGLPWEKYKPIQKKEKHNPLEIFTQFVIAKDVYDEPIISEIKKPDGDYYPLIHVDFFKEGITKKTIDKFGLLYSYKYHRTMIPLRDWRTGCVLGFNGRTSIKNYDELGITKYWITPGYNKIYNLFGLWENRDDIEKKHRLVIYESEKSVLKRDSRCDPTGVAISGHYLSEQQVKIILSLDVNEIVIAMDKDVKILEVLHMCEQFYKLRHTSFIFDKHGLLGDHDSPADLHNSDYEKLFNSRISYTDKLHKAYLKKIQEGK